MTTQNQNQGQLHLYKTERTPSRWAGWLNRDMAREQSQKLGGEQQLTDCIRDTQEAARGLGFSGNIADGPFVSGLPDLGASSGSDYESCMIGFRDDKGQVFIGSPVELPHISNIGVTHARREALRSAMAGNKPGNENQQQRRGGGDDMKGEKR